MIRNILGGKCSFNGVNSSDDELDQIEEHPEKLVAKLQERDGICKPEAERQVD
jgi:uncharacterized protein YjbJ (UPF0337 family)